MSEEIVQNEQEEIVETVEKKPKKQKSSSGDMDFTGLEIFYEKNKKVITYGGGALLAIVALFSFYKFYWLPGQEQEANNEAFYAQGYFERDSFNLALNGGPQVTTSEGIQKTMMGFREIADSYGSTKTGNLANYYAGICLLRTGKFEEAIEMLEKFSGNDEILAPVATGAIGDAYMELNNIDEAIKFYLKASDKANNGFTTPIYLKKAAFAYEQKANYTEALATYERLKNEFGKSSDAREVDKYIARVKTLGNIQ
jgi:tetratricopeptide (TPR) repeat protein